MAGSRIMHAQYLKVNGTDVNAYALTSGAAVYSDAIDVRKSFGYAALLVLLADSDDVDITFEVSMDGTNFYIPYDSSGNDKGKVYTTLTASKWISLTPKVAQWIRFKLDPDHDSTATIKYLHQEA